MMCDFGYRLRVGGATALTLVCAGLSGCKDKREIWANTPVPYFSGDQPYVDLALDHFRSHSPQTREQELRSVYAVAVELPDAVCVGFHARPHSGAEESTYCYDKETGELLTLYVPDIKPEYLLLSEKLKRPHYGEVDERHTKTEPAKPSH